MIDSLHTTVLNISRADHSPGLMVVEITNTSNRDSHVTTGKRGKQLQNLMSRVALTP